MTKPMYVTEENDAFLTDLYELTMAAGYWSNQMNGRATFELYFRRLPAQRSYVIAAGLEQALYYICNLKFSQSQIGWLKSLPPFSHVESGFFDYLSEFRFSGDVWAVPEGTPVFPLEPLIQITAPLIEAQILETYLLSVLNMQSMVATKAARIVRAAAGKGVVDFGARRAHGPQAGVLAARAAYIGGCLGTSNVLAGYLAGIPVYGTSAHSFIMAFPRELDAFQAYYRLFPESTVLLIDTYNTREAAQKIREVGAGVQGVRIDSGDLLALSREVRQILDRDGLTSVKIFASGDLNEYKIAGLLASGAPIDLFGVGTELTTSYDAPALNGVYKLVEATIHGRTESRAKTSPGKASYPGRKQVYRFRQGSTYSYDRLSLADEKRPEDGEPLLQCYVHQGVPVEPLPALEEIQKSAAKELHLLPDILHDLQMPGKYSVVFSEGMKRAYHGPEVSGNVAGS